MSELRVFLEERGISQENIAKIEQNKIDSNVIALMTVDQLTAYIPSYGDRLAVKDFCQRTSQGSSYSRRDSLLTKLKSKFQLKSKRADLVGNDFASKPQRRIELGWLHFDEKGQDYKQVRTKNRGGTRHLIIDKSNTKVDLIRLGEELFFPQGKSTKGDLYSFDCDIKDFSLKMIDYDTSIGHVFEKTKLRILRFYFCTRKKSSFDTDSLPEVCGGLMESSGKADIADDTEIIFNFGSASQASVQQELDLNSTIEYVIPEELSDTDSHSSALPLGLNDDEATVKFPFKYVIQIRRENCLNDMIHKFKDPSIIHSNLIIECIDSKGMIERGEGIGILKDTFTHYWTEFYKQCTVGTNFKVPYIRNDFQEEEWRAAARILKKGFDMFNYIPISLAPVWVEDVLYGSMYSDILSVYCMYISKDDHDLIKHALDSYHSVDEEDILDFLSSHDSRQAPNAQNLKRLILEIAHKELIQKPRFVTDCWKEIATEMAVNLPPEKLKQLYSDTLPTCKKVAKLVKPLPADLMSPEKSNVMKFLVQFIKELNNSNLKRFLRFCTGCDLILDYSAVIQVEFIEQTDFLRRPVSHTCGQILELSDSYNSYPEFRTEFLNVLEYTSWEIDIA